MKRGEKPSAPTWSSAAVVRTLVLGVAVVNLFAFLLVGHALHQSWSQHRERAVVATQNLSAAIEQYLVGLFDKVDLALLAVADENEREVASGGIVDPTLAAFIARQRQRVPEIAAIRTIDARGDIEHGDGVRPDRRLNVSDRAYFLRLRDEPGAGLVVSKPIVGRICSRLEIILGRRVHRPDGLFSGAVIAAIPIEEIERIFATFNVGRRGIVVLRDADLGVIVRHKAEGAVVPIGNRTVSPELLGLLRKGRTEGTYTGGSVDGIERTITFRKLLHYPLYAIVGLAFDDYLGEWRRQALADLAVVASFAVLTALAAWSVYRSWRRREVAVQALAQQETRFRLVAESATDLIWMTDRGLRLTYLSPAVERLLGYTAEEAMALPLSKLFSAALLEKIAMLGAQVRATAPFSQPFAQMLLEQELIRKDGRLLHAEAHFNLLWSPEGRVAGALGISRDVTEHREMQERVQVAERMASMGTLAAGVAHEVNNPLTYVLTNVGFALDQLRATEADWSGRSACAPLRDAAQALAEALTGADRVRAIVRDLRTFSRADDDRAAPVEVNPVVEGCLKMTASLTSARARIVRRLGKVPRVRASEARLAQVFLNLIVNAAQAIPEGSPGDHEIAVATSVAADGRVEIEVRDTGSGIAADVLTRIFDPFFTTKPVGEGTGLGLSICHGIVQALGGEIQVESAATCGSRFRVLLPPAPSDLRDVAEVPRVEGPPPSRRRVLVVDDDPLVARAVARLIGDGCAVDVITVPAQALTRIASGERWDLILCDLNMPEVSGMDLHARVVELDPALADRIVFMTGGAFTPRAQDFLGRVPNARLDKPIDRSALAQILESGRATGS